MRPDIVVTRQREVEKNVSIRYLQRTLVRQKVDIGAAFCAQKLVLSGRRKGKYRLSRADTAHLSAPNTRSGRTLVRLNVANVRIQPVERYLGILVRRGHEYPAAIILRSPFTFCCSPLPAYTDFFLYGPLPGSEPDHRITVVAIPRNRKEKEK